MATPNPRDKRPSREEGTTFLKITIGGLYVCMVILFITALVQNNKRGGSQQAEMLLLQKSMPVKRNITESDAPDPRKEADELMVPLKKYDLLIADVNSRIASYNDPLARLVSELSALNQTSDRLEAIGDVRGRNEFVYQYNEKSRRLNALAAEQSRFIAYQRTLVLDRNKIAVKINQLQAVLVRK